MESSQIADCEFCRIVLGENESVEIVASTENWVAFFPLRPATRGHTLVIPRMHVPDLWETQPGQAAELTYAVVKVGTAIKSALAPDGMNLITSAGDAAEQTVFHLHLHLVPRWYKDDFGPIWKKQGDHKPADLVGTAEQIRRAYSSLRDEY